MGENIGMVARAMMNFGLSDLAIVNPRDGWPNPQATATASGAVKILEEAKLFKTTKEAIADLHYVFATTARDRDMSKEVFLPHAAATKIKELNEKSAQTGILFGAERTGLENDDIAASHAIITYPTNPDFSSLNLAQAVLLMAYEIGNAQTDMPDVQLTTGKSDIATKESMDNFLQRLYDRLDQNGFFKSNDMRPSIERNIETLFLRGQLTEQEVSTLHGIVACLSKNSVAD
tara:strand:+ start:2140 stop:2835 length:696 start_codon:yes stop_codon:yes gene_type:complete